MTDFIEQDALQDTTYSTPPIRDHPAHEVKSFVATPRMDATLMQKMISMFKTQLAPMVSVVQKDDHSPRYLLSITSNSYVDRENERILSAALKAYEESCYPAEDVFHCDNPYVWWHDDDVVMGEIVAVNYSEPFLVELIKEIEGDPVSKVLFDFAAKNGDQAGASHKFGYLSDDRTEDGEYSQIFKQESTYLPIRDLAANGMTYAGVITDMASKQSNEWLDKVFKEATGVDGISNVLHSKSSERAQKLAELKGLVFKATKPPFAKTPAVDAAAMETDAMAAEAVAEGEDVAEEETEVTSGPIQDVGAYMAVMEGIGTLVMQLVDAQMEMMGNQTALAKAMKERDDMVETEKAAEKTTLATLQAQVKALSDKVSEIQTALALTPRSVTQDKDKGMTGESIIEAVQNVGKAITEGDLVDSPVFGKQKPAPDYSKIMG